MRRRDSANMALGDEYRDYRLNMLRLRLDFADRDTCRLVVVTAGIDAMGNIAGFEDGSVGEPVEMWLAFRLNKPNTQPLRAGR